VEFENELNNDYLASLLHLQSKSANNIHDVILQGLKDFPGVDSILWENKKNGINNQNTIELPLKYKGANFGCLQLITSDKSKLIPFLPYLHNFTALLTVLIANNKNATTISIQERFFEMAPDLLSIASDKGYFTKLSLSWEKTLGWSRDELYAKPFFEFIHPDDLHHTKDVLNALIDGQDVVNYINRYRHKDGSYRCLEWTSYPENEETFFATARDITNQQKDEQIIHQLAYHDQLTGLANRTLLQDRFKHAISTAKRNRSRMALLFIDLDNFKSVNDTLGHDAGDEVIKVQAKRLFSCIRESDTVARFGGDEFIIFIDKIKNTSDISRLAKKILTVLAKPIKETISSVTLTSSIGISIYPDDGENYDKLMKSADTAMYTAKAFGKNNFRYFSSAMMAKVDERLNLEMELRDAISNNQFEMYYQPRICLANKKVSGAEALIRWNHPQKGLICPLLFIPYAEEAGLINEIGRQVIGSVIKQIAQWKIDLVKEIPVAINISALQFNEGEIRNTIIKQCELHDVSPNLVELEITEKVVMENPEKSTKTLQDLRNIGVRIAIDDFGTGQSSLAYLKKLPLDTLKIDKSFIHDIETNADDIAIVKIIIALAKVLGLDIIAEGVELSIHEKMLDNLSCQHAQGFYYAKPMPAKEFATFMYQQDIEAGIVQD
jgi:diguanylate cyclase (GGDEF)-like protein/PAS domain S-box-containing protein